MHIFRTVFGLVCLAGLLAAAVLYGFSVAERKAPPYATLDELHTRLRAKLSSGPPDAARWNPLDAGAATGVVSSSARAFPGLNLYNSAHAAEATLTDMTGTVLHTWRMPYTAAFPNDPAAPGGASEFWRRVHLYENGDLLAIYEYEGIIRIDRDSKLIWARHDGSHHDIEVQGDGAIWTLGRIERVNPSIHPWKQLLEDTVTVLAPNGRELASHPILEAVQRSHFASLLDFAADHGDILHANSLALRDGRALLSLSYIGTIAIMDLAKGEIVWAVSGLSRRQHDAEFLPNGNILLIDNRGHRGFSKVVELDPRTQELAWSYLGDEANGFFTERYGANQRLPNGNTLITESNAGRAFEVSADGEIVWEFLNPHRSDEPEPRIATLLELQRLPADFPRAWARR